MKRCIGLILFALTLALAACGSDPTPPAATMDTFFPKDNDVAGWVQNTAKDSTTGPSLFTDSTVIDKTTDLDGDVVPFVAAGLAQFGREHYKNATYTVDLRIWKMKDAATGAGIYSSLLVDVDRYKVINFTSETMGSAGRWGNSGNTWRINSYKGAYFVEALLTPSEVTDTAGKDAGVAIVKFVMGKIP